MNFPGRDVTRNADVVPGVEDFYDAIDLPGWDDRGTWGYDPGMRSFYAQLWRNGSTAEDPEIWLNGASQPLAWPSCILVRLVELTGVDPLTVMNALGLAAHDGPIASPQSFMDQLEEVGRQPSPYPYVEGQRIALLWLLGQESTCPGSGWSWTPSVPSRTVVNAEMLMANGDIYLRGLGGVASGVEEVLVDALSDS